MKFNNELKNTIIGSSMTQKKAAEILNTSIRNIENWISGKNEPNEITKTAVIEKLQNYNEKPDEIQIIKVFYKNGGFTKHKAEKNTIVIENSQIRFAGFEEIKHLSNFIKIDLKNEKIDRIEI